MILSESAIVLSLKQQHTIQQVTFYVTGTRACQAGDSYRWAMVSTVQSVKTCRITLAHTIEIFEYHQSPLMQPL
jgi:hypothetical protein|eukprot:SAG25_NODE_677_length_5979_cov_2.486395_8_plen_74_part_00